ncbi:MAG: replication-relaxation family protein, partial [Actinobacteria bacterium]|nr:replication-relaxation family protein [Actinomycetota bacterium]
MTTSPRPVSPRLWRLEAQLTERDWVILATLAKLRLACTRQIERLHFTDSSPMSNARHARRVLGKLVELRLVSRLERRVGG